MHQTRLSLQLRKRTLERSESVIPPSKRQVKDITDAQVSAFGAPHLEEKKIIKRTIHSTLTATTEEPKQRRSTRQTTLKQLAKPLSPSEQTPGTGSKVEAESTSLKSTTAATTKQQEISHAKNSCNTIENISSSNDDTLPDSVSTTTEFESSTISNSPSSSSSLHARSKEETATSPLQGNQHIDTNDINDTIPLSLPSTASIPPQKASIEKTSPPTVLDEKLIKSPSPSSPVVESKYSLSKFDKERIHEERSLLDKLVSALDITLTFHAARNVAAFFHKIQPMLRNSTCKNVTLSHLCKILFVAPELYDVEAKLLKEYGKDTEAHQVSIGSIWKMPLTGKVIEERNDLMTKRSGEYFEQHKEALSTIPEKELPRMDKVVDRKKWLQNANLPDRVRSVLELQEKLKAAKEEKANQPRIEPQGTAKDRAKALLDRIRNKQKK